MPNLTRADIVRIADVMLRAGGAPQSHAMTVAEHLADANLAGHDSHGFIRIPQYLGSIKDGSLDPKAHPEVVREHGATALVEGNKTFGQVVAAFATELAIERAREFGVSMVAMGNLNHVGRVGAYTEMAAREGMAGIMCAGFYGGSTLNNVAPFGGRARRLGTNPISISFPLTDEGPVLMDFASSIAAEGKLRVYRNRGQELPDEWVIDKDGVPSRDPNDYYDGGAILPIGGTKGGHKGYALSVMVALLGGLLGEIASPGSRLPEIAWGGCSIVVIDVGGLSPINEVKSQADRMIRYLKDTPTMEGSDEVLYPGEIEARSRRQRLEHGVDIEDATWDQVSGLFHEYGVEDELKGLG
jgi:uncharacterized oxidoreductase